MMKEVGILEVEIKKVFNKLEFMLVFIWYGVKDIIMFLMDFI